MSGIVNIVIGGAFIVGGLSGKVVLIGTESGAALAGVGAVLVVWGIVQMSKAREK